MHPLYRRLTLMAAFAAASLSPLAQAASTVIDFESVTPAGVQPDAGDSFSQADYVMTVGTGFGSIGKVIDFGAGEGAPSGNATNFFSAFNDGDLLLERADGSAFSLDAFSFAYVPLAGAASSGYAMVAYGFGAALDGSQDQVAAYLFAGSSTGNYPFATASAATSASLAKLNNVLAVDFFSCAVVSGSLSCASTVTRNGAQFALDNIRVTSAVPEPASVVLLTAGLLGLALRRRHAGRRAAC